MLPTANGHRKSSGGKVNPTDGETIKKLSQQEINNTHVKLPEDPVQPTEAITKKSIFARLFKKKEKEAQTKKKPEGPKLKAFEIVCLPYVSIDHDLHLWFLFFSINLLTNGMFFSWSSEQSSVNILILR